MLKLKLQYSVHLMGRADSLEKTLMLGKIEGGRRRGRQRRRWLDGITDSMNTSLSKLWETEGRGSLACCSPWGHQELDTTEQVKNKNKWGTDIFPPRPEMEPTLRSFCSGNRNLNPWTAGEVLSCVFFHLFKASHLSVQATFRLLMTRTSSNSHQLLNEMCPQGAFSLLHSLISTCQYEFLRNLFF